MSSTEFDFECLVGGEFDFYGADDQRFRLDDTVYQAIEEHLDTAHSSLLDYIEVCKDSKGTFDLPIARVVVEDDCCGIYELIDLHDGHCWLRFGTEYRYNEASGESFVFEYTPRTLS